MDANAAPTATVDAVRVEAPTGAQPNGGFTVALTSRLGTGTVALTAILVLLIVGVWYFGHRLASQLSTRRVNYA